jgi:hypothetical protein
MNKLLQPKRSLVRELDYNDDLEILTKKISKPKESIKRKRPIEIEDRSTSENSSDDENVFINNTSNDLNDSPEYDKMDVIFDKYTKNVKKSNKTFTYKKVIDPTFRLHLIALFEPDKKEELIKRLEHEVKNEKKTESQKALEAERAQRFYKKSKVIQQQLTSLKNQMSFISPFLKTEQPEFSTPKITNYAKSFGNAMARCYKKYFKTRYTWVNPTCVSTELLNILDPNNQLTKSFFTSEEDITNCFRVFIDCNKCLGKRQEFEDFFVKKYPTLDTKYFVDTEGNPLHFDLSFKMEIYDLYINNGVQFLDNFEIKLKKFTYSEKPKDESEMKYLIRDITLNLLKPDFLKKLKNKNKNSFISENDLEYWNNYDHMLKLDIQCESLNNKETVSSSQHKDVVPA